ncbi:uncharacterized protein N7484_006595 [Penicillium longicatenatum]|uniref:uncharacterized protein n=1 Tax=Penicillium longicatenatum TaxID=1561947 RepID=UPI002548EAD6|nr:uncharacterized protein N7484_006595 [Penicillium longicatenatum]KAJ5644088.1 hypothetical protein N7484_006595 [Penicillium longicatenatum]
MPHADASYFFPGSSKADIYEQVLDQTKGLCSGQRNWVSNLSNVSSLLWHAYAALPAPSSSVNWAGFYIRDDKFPALASPISSPPLSGADGVSGVTISTTYASPENQVLLLGPFHGKPACQQISFGKGVCGTAAANQETLIVPDVLKFPGHIACDAESRSEVVVPIVIRGETVAIIDIDCTEPNGFDDEDKKYLEALAEILATSCDW